MKASHAALRKWTPRSFSSRPPVGWPMGRVFSAVLVLQLLIALSYTQFVAPVYAYSGFVSRPANLGHLAISIVIGSIPVLWLPTRPATPGQVLLWLLQIFVVCSSCALGPLIPYRGIWESIGWSIWNVTCMAAASLFLILPKLNLSRYRLTHVRGRRLFFVCFLVIFALLIAWFGVPRPEFSLHTAQSRRLAFRESLAASGVLAGYLLVWAQSLFAPISIMSGVVRKRPLGVVLGGSVIFWFYLSQGTRTSLAVIPLGAALWVGLKRGISAAQYVWGAVALLVVSVATFLVTNSTMVLGLAVKRLFIVPGALSMFYFDFFATGPPGLYRDSFGSLISGSPYPLEIPRMIGASYLGSQDTNANVNVFSDAFAQLWLAGLLLPVVVALVLWLLDSLVEGLNQPAVLGSMSLMAIALINTGTSNWLSTNGMALGLLIYWLAGPGLFPSTSDGFGRLSTNARPTSNPWPMRAVP